MHAEVNHSVSAEIVLKPLVIGGVLRMRREISLEEQTHRITLDAERWLNSYEDVSQLESGDDAPLTGAVARPM